MIVETYLVNMDFALNDSSWQAIMSDEIKVMENNLTWDLVDKPSGKKPIDVK